MMSEIRFYLSILMRRLPLVILITALTTAAAVVYALSLPRSYTSAARLLVEAPQVTDGVSSSTVSTPPLAMMNMVQQMIMARDNLVALARRHGVVPEPGLPEEQVAGLMATAISLRNASTGPDDSSVVTTVTVTGSTAETAAAVAQDVIDQIMAEGTRQRTTVASGTLGFIRAEAERLAEELEQRSQAIVDFQNRNSDALPTGLDYRANRRASLRTDLQTAQKDLESMRNQEQSIRAIAQNDAGGSSLQLQLEQVRADLAAARLIFSETNPRVTRLVARAAQIEEQMRAAAAAPPEERGDGTGNIVADMQLADLTERRRLLEEQLPAIRAEIDELTRAIDATPANASALAALEREQSAAQDRYDEARARLVLAQNGERLELSDQAQRISVLEAPSVPAWPSAPNRKLIAAAGLAAGLGLSFGLILLLELLGGRVRRSADLVRALEITPIATIPLLPAKARA